MRAELCERVRRHLAGALGFPPPIVDQTVELARAHVGKQLALLEDCLGKGDAQGVRAAAHTLKGDLGNIGLGPEAELALSLEGFGRDARLDLARPLARELRGLLEGFVPAS